MDIKELNTRIENYLANEDQADFKKQIEDLQKANNQKELEERFYRDLDFGTGGMRGKIGGGTNRMNPLMVRKATQGFADYLKEQLGSKEITAAIAYDSRNYSRLFAETAARCFAANGIKVYLFTDLRPTPELSFAVRHLNTDAGLVITASHNPAEYNGYKVYWNDGAQVTPPHDKGIIAKVEEVTSFGPLLSLEEAKSKGLVEMIDQKVDKAYFDMVQSQSLRPKLIKEHGKELKVVYTALHGTGTYPIKTVLSAMGIEVISVKEQEEADGDFPTVDFPNPEIQPAMDMALQLAKKEKADIVIGTDPDADRIGIAVPDKQGNYQLITGNQLGALLADYLFMTLKEQKKLPANSAFINTIVTTQLQNEIAESYGARTWRVLTGFKWICAKIREFEAAPDGPKYIFGGEESYGFLVGTSVRDKDGVSAAAMVCEMALYNLSQGRSMLDHLNQLYEDFGYYEEILISQYFEGQEGHQIMQKLMSDLRNNPPQDFGGLQIIKIKDYKEGKTKELERGKTIQNIDLPSSNVLQFLLKDGSMVTARPSGTEPKIKFYASVRAARKTPLAAAKETVELKIKNIEEQIRDLVKQ